MKYIKNCFLLIIPILLWNLAFVSFLPESYSSSVFWKDIPPIIGTSENILRVFTLGLPTFMIFSVQSTRQKLGFKIYLSGVLIYFTSWAVMMCIPESDWSTSLLGFCAPAYTTIIWFIGITLIGSKNYFKIPYLSFVYGLLSVMFVIIHTTHALIVFQRL